MEGCRQPWCQGQLAETRLQKWLWSLRLAVNAREKGSVWGLMAACTWELDSPGRTPEHLVRWGCKLESLKTMRGRQTSTSGRMWWAELGDLGDGKAYPSGSRYTWAPSVGGLFMYLLYPVATLKKLVSLVWDLSSNCILVLLWQSSSSFKKKMTENVVILKHAWKHFALAPIKSF